MKRFLIAGALALALPVMSMAATFSNVQFNNGDVTISGQGGSTVQATFHVIVHANQVVEYIQTDVTGDNLAPVDTSVGGELGLQEGTHDVTLSIKLPPNTGTYSLNVKGAGIFGGVRSISGDDNVVGTASFSSSLRVVADSSDSTTGSSMPAWFSAWLKAMGFGNTPTPTPAPSTKCTELNTKLVGTVDNTYNDANIRLQGYLLSEGASIPALAAGASFGYKGPQTRAAVSWFQTMNHCL